MKRFLLPLLLLVLGYTGIQTWLHSYGPPAELGAIETTPAPISPKITLHSNIPVPPQPPSSSSNDTGASSFRSEGSFTNKNIPITDEENRQIAATGFAPDASRPSLGQAYRDRRGLLWGEIWRKEGETAFNDATSMKLSYAEAEAFCAKDGNRLPTKKEYDNLIADFGGSKETGHLDTPTDDEWERIKSQLYQGAIGPNGGYNPYFENRPELLFPTLLFQRTWTSTLVPGKPDRVWIFNSKYGIFQEWSKDLKEPFLCVFNPKEKTLPQRK